MADSTRSQLRLREQDLIGKVAVVTGASRGIGRAIVLNLASRGCNVLGTYSSLASAELFGQTSTAVGNLYDEQYRHSPDHDRDGNNNGALPSRPKIIGIQADSNAPDCVTTIAGALETHFDGTINILIHNAAMLDRVYIGTAEASVVESILRTNIQTPLLVTDELVRRKMFQPKSRIINISSDRARVPADGSLAYSASKAGLEALARNWALILGGNDEKYGFMAGTTANSVSVGLTVTTALERVPRDHAETLLAEVLRRQTIAPDGHPHWAYPDEVVDIVGFLCSAEARWISGSVIPANGGHSMIG